MLCTINNTVTPSERNFVIFCKNSLVSLSLRPAAGSSKSKSSGLAHEHTLQKNPHDSQENAQSRGYEGASGYGSRNTSRRYHFAIIGKRVSPQAGQMDCAGMGRETD